MITIWERYFRPSNERSLFNFNRLAFYLHLCNVMRQTGSTKWHRFGIKALCTETKLRNSRVLLVDYYAVKINSWYTIKTLLTNRKQIFYHSIMYSIEDMLAGWLDVWKKRRSEREVYCYIWENYKYFWFPKNVVTNVRFTIILNCDIPQILFLSVHKLSNSILRLYVLILVELQEG